MTVGLAPVAPVRLKALLPDAQFVGCTDLSVAGLATEATEVEPGEIFVAGARADDAEVRMALERGAAAVVSQRFHPIAGHPQVLVADADEAIARIAQVLTGEPTRRLDAFAVTGARGKTETAWFLRSILELNGRSCGLLGPEEWSDGSRTRPIGHETLHGGHVARVVAAMADRGCKAAVMELSIGSLARRASDGMCLAGAIVGRLEWTQPAELKVERFAARLMRAVSEDGLILIDGSEPAAGLLRAVRLDVPILTFGLESDADVSGEVDSMDLDATMATFHLPSGSIRPRIGRPGLGSVRAALGAAMMAWQAGVGLDAIREGVEQVDSIPGRLDRISGGPIEVRIDRARTAVEVVGAIAALRESGAKRVHCVAAARYERDPLLLEALGRALEAEADSVIVSPSQGPGDASDAAVDALLAHFPHAGRVARSGDRLAAIRSALALAKPGDAVLLTGRGEERSIGWAGASALESDAALARASLDEIASWMLCRSA